MPFEDVLRNVALTLVRFSIFAGNGIVFGCLPIALGVLRPALSEEDAEARRRVAARLEGFVRAALIATAFGTALGLLIQATLVSQVTGSELGSTDLESVLSTPFGRWQVLRLPVAAAIWFLVCPRIGAWSLGTGRGTSRRHLVWWTAWALLAGGLLVATTMSSHAVVSSPRGVALVNDFVHLAAGSTWFAGVLALAVALPDSWRGRGPQDRLRLLAGAVTRFSRVAMVSIGIVALTGTVNSFLNLARPLDLIETNYGRTLAIKIAFFGLILLLGAVNHYVVRRRLEEAARAGAGDADRLFRKTIAAELALAFVVLLLTGLLVGLARTRESVAETNQRRVAILSITPPSEPIPAARRSAITTASTDAFSRDTMSPAGPAKTLVSASSLARPG